MDKTINEIWNAALQLIQQQISLQEFETWIKPLQPGHINGDIITLKAPNSFLRDWLIEHYKSMLPEALSTAAGQPCKINIEIIENFVPQQVLPENKSPAETTIVSESSLNPKYVFSKFIEGTPNRFALAASKAVAEAPGKAYNPLFIYGKSGLGKTHLLHAIGNFIKNSNPQAKIVYITSEEFLNQMVKAIIDANLVAFRSRFRNVHVFLIDDIQFFEGKESSQEELFHTFNALYNANCQIVASSDSHPKELKIEERLRSRFEMGLVADIQVPDLELRRAIIQQKSIQEKVALPEDVSIFLANNFTTNIRVLEGVFIRVVAYASLTHSPITTDLAKEVLKDILQGEPDDIRVTIDLIKKKVVEFYGLKPADMVVKKRTKAIAFPRQVAMYLARELTDCSLPEIGENFGGRDHTTVIHAYETVKSKLESDAAFSAEIQKLINSIKG